MERSTPPPPTTSHLANYKLSVKLRGRHDNNNRVFNLTKHDFITASPPTPTQNIRITLVVVVVVSLKSIRE